MRYYFYYTAKHALRCESTQRALVTDSANEASSDGRDYEDEARGRGSRAFDRGQRCSAHAQLAQSPSGEHGGASCEPEWPDPVLRCASTVRSAHAKVKPSDTRDSSGATFEFQVPSRATGRDAAREAIAT